MWMISAALAGQPTWPETVVEQIELQAEQIADAQDDASELKDHRAVACLAEPAGAAHNALQRAQAAEQRWEAAVDDDNAYAIETEVLELQAQQARAQVAWSEAYQCWPSMGNASPGRSFQLRMPSLGPAWISVGGARHSDPLMAQGGDSLVGIGALGVEGSTYHWLLSSSTDASIWAERWNQVPLNHWVGIDGQTVLTAFPDSQVRLVVEEDLQRDPMLTSSPLGGTLSLLDHDGRAALQTGWYRQASLGFDHRLQRAVLPDETRQVQQYGPSARLHLPVRMVQLRADAHLHRLVRAETRGRELRGELMLGVPLTWWATLQVSGGLTRLHLDNRFGPDGNLVGQVALMGYRDYSTLWLAAERDYGSTWLDHGTLQHALRAGYEGWVGNRLMVGLDGRYGTTQFYPTFIQVVGLPVATQVLTVDGVVGVRLGGPVRVDLRGQHVRRWGNVPANDTSVGLHLVIDP